MKAKTLLVAAAALAAATISSQAQVYSQNVVGYVNITLTNNVLQLICNPLDNGTNTAADVLTALPNKSQVQMWNGTGFTAFVKTSTGYTVGGVLVAAPSMPPGVGFFVKAFSACTNTFVGSVIPASGTNTSIQLTNNILQLVGSQMPVAGSFTDVGTNALNLYATLPNKSQIQMWNGSGFTAYVKTSTGYTLGGVLNNPNYTVGQGFFVKAFSTTNWVQYLGQ